MGEYLKRSENEIVESRAMAEDVQLISSKKRRLCVELENEHRNEEILENYVSSAASVTSVCSKYDHESSAGGLTDRNSRSPDLENVHSDDFETEMFTSSSGLFSGEETPTSELSGDSKHGIMYTSSTSTERKSLQSPPYREIPVEKMPSAAELEEFFAAAENLEQKRFSEKYNYDIVKDVPLEGKYQWVRSHP